MKIAVFDTYVVRPDGRRMHFDILVEMRPRISIRYWVMVSAT